MAAPTSAYTFEDLILEVALFLGTAYYGAAGNQAPAIPTDAHDLAEAQRIVNSGIRRFFLDAPVHGWRFTRPVMQFTAFGPVSESSTRTVTGGVYDSGNDETTLTCTADVFFPGMEYRDLVLATSGTVRMKRYISATQMVVEGDSSAVSAEQFSIDTQGNYTLPADFAGDLQGPITYARDSNDGVAVQWVDEGKIRRWRENTDSDSGDPWMAAVRPAVDADARAARRWEILFYPSPREDTVFEFPYHLHFDSLVNNSDTPPTPHHHDETLRLACLAEAEAGQDDRASSHHQQRYERALMQSHRIDARAAPQRLGYNGDPMLGAGIDIQKFRGSIYDRPNVEYNT